MIEIIMKATLWWRCPETKVYNMFLQLTYWANRMCIILLYIYTTALLSPHCLVTPCKNCDIAFYHISWQHWSVVQVISHSFVVLIYFITHCTAYDTSLKCFSGSVCAPSLSLQRIILCLDLWDIFPEHLWGVTMKIKCHFLFKVISAVVFTQRQCHNYCYKGWQDIMATLYNVNTTVQCWVEVHLFASQLSSLGLNPDPAVNCHLGDSSLCVSSLGRMLNGCPICWH